MGKDGQAVDEFMRFIKDYPSSSMAVDARFWLGEYYASKAHFDKSREYYYSVVKDSSSSDLTEKALYQAAVTFEEEGKSEEAVAKFEDLASRFPDSESAKQGYKKIARIKKDAKDFSGAIEYLKKALGRENNELNAQRQYEIAECFEEKADLTKAAEEYLKVPDLFSKGKFWALRAQLKAAQVLERLNKTPEAKMLYEKLADMDVEESAFAKKRLEWIKWHGNKEGI